MTFAFDGLVFEVPAEWEVTIVEHGPQKGYFQFEDAIGVRLAVRWQQATNFTGIRATRAYFERLRGTLKRKQRAELTVQGTHQILVGRREPRLEAASTDYTLGTLRGTVVTFLVPSCRRAFLVGLQATGEPPGRRLRRRLFDSFHFPAEEDPRRWEFGGISFTAPPSWKYFAHQFVSGHVRLHFRQEGRHLNVARWGLANLMLSKTPLEVIGRRALFAWGFKSGEIRAEPYPGGPGEGSLRLVGRPVSRYQRFSALARKLLRPSLSSRLHGFIWQVPAQNALGLVAVGAHQEPPLEELLALSAALKFTAAVSAEARLGACLPETAPPIKKGRPLVDRHRQLAMRPLRNPLVEMTRSASGVVLIAPMAATRAGRLVRKLAGAPSGQPHIRRLELDEVGTFIWQLADGAHSVEDLVFELAGRYRLGRKEAEVLLLQFLKTLQRKGLIALQVAQLPQGVTLNVPPLVNLEPTAPREEERNEAENSPEEPGR